MDAINTSNWALARHLLSQSSKEVVCSVAPPSHKLAGSTALHLAAHRCLHNSWRGRYMMPFYRELCHKVGRTLPG
jgi:hypothetical protein